MAQRARNQAGVGAWSLSLKLEPRESYHELQAGSIQASLMHPVSQKSLTTMALNPRFAGHRLGKAGGHTVELYLDYTCPWSGKIFDKHYKVLRSLINPVLIQGPLPIP